MKVIRGRERDCRQEIRGQARRGGTRSTQRVDSQRQAFRPAADEGAHSVEAGHIGCGRRRERQPDRRGAGHQHRHCRADQAPAGRGRVRGGVGPQIQLELRPAADFRRRGGSKTDRADALSGPGRLCQMEPASARGEGCRTAHCRARQRQHDRAEAVWPATEQDINACLDSEQKARDQIVKDLATYSSADKTQCMRTDVYLPSYVEWLTCLEMERDVRKERRQEETFGQGGPYTLPKVRSAINEGRTVSAGVLEARAND